MWTNRLALYLITATIGTGVFFGALYRPLRRRLGRAASEGGESRNRFGLPVVSR